MTAGQLQQSGPRIYLPTYQLTHTRTRWVCQTSILHVVAGQSEEWDFHLGALKDSTLIGLFSLSSAAVQK